MSQDQSPTSDRRLKWFIAMALVVVTVATYRPCFNYPFVDHDDYDYVANNPHVKTGLTAENIRWAFTSFQFGNWHPLTWLSLQLDSTLYGGMNAGGYHATNVLLHAANSM